MTALDTSSMIAFLSGERGADVNAVEAALALRQAVFPPVVVTELLSDPATYHELADLIRAVPMLEVFEVWVLGTCRRASREAATRSA